MTTGCLYIVATPIGNLEDLSPRAERVLRDADLIAAEDTRHSRRLLRHFGIATRLVACHEHNEDTVAEELVGKLKEGARIALITDAGTPLLSDPGFRLVRRAREGSIEVIAVPGPSALTAALSVAGLPVNRFLFEGFLPADRRARLARLREVEDEMRTIVYFEAPHRILRALKDMAEVFGGERRVALARELTKVHEEVLSDSLSALIERMEAGGAVQKGEFVVIVAGSTVRPTEGDGDALLRLLLPELPPRKAVDIVAKLTGGNRRDIYRRAVEMRGEK